MRCQVSEKFIFFVSGVTDAAGCQSRRGVEEGSDVSGLARRTPFAPPNRPDVARYKSSRCKVGMSEQRGKPAQIAGIGFQVAADESMP